MDKLLIIGYGNPGRGDDALGPMLAEHIESLSAAKQWQHIDVLTAYQLQIENVMDLAEYQLVLFIDAHTRCHSPYQFDPCLPEQGQSYTSHALTPDALLAVYLQAFKTEPPACYLLSIYGESFELGHSLSPIASNNLQSATKFVEQLCQSLTDNALDKTTLSELTLSYA